MNRRRRLVVVLACVGCLLAVASALPAADPRLDAPGGESAAAGGWDAIVGEPTLAEDIGDDRDADGNDGGSDTTDGASTEITVVGALEPGNDVTIEMEDSSGISHFDPPMIEVNGAAAGEPTPFGRLEDVTVPHAETMTVAVPDHDLSETFDVETDATVRLHDSAAPGSEADLSAAVGSTPLQDATVSVDGEVVGTTGSDGRATVTLPQETGEVEVAVERDPVEGSTVVDIAAPEVSFTSPLLVPGSLAPVRVTADEGGVPNATVAIVGGDEAAALEAMDGDDAATIEGESVTTTDDDGSARLWLPLDDEATLVATAGGETTTATVGNLYLRLTAVIVIVPGFVIGGVVAYLRLARRYDHEPGNEFAALFVGIASLLDALADLVRVPSFPSVSWPTIRVPTGFGRSIGAAIGSVLAGLASLPSIGSATRSTGGRVGSIVRSGIDALSRESDESDGGAETREAAGRTTAGEPLGPESPERTIREAWHAFCDHVGIQRRETRTPGEVARRAVETGYPSGTVEYLLSTLRDVEYGGQNPTSDRAARARDAVAGLVGDDPNAGRDETGTDTAKSDDTTGGRS